MLELIQLVQAQKYMMPNQDNKPVLINELNSHSNKNRKVKISSRGKTIKLQWIINSFFINQPS